MKRTTRIISLSIMFLILASLCGCATSNDSYYDALYDRVANAVGVTDSTAANDNDSDAGNTVSAGMEFLGLSKPNGHYGTFYYYRDIITDVVYVTYREKHGYAGMGGLTVMMDPENELPLTFSRWQQLYESKSDE